MLLASNTHSVLMSMQNLQDDETAQDKSTRILELFSTNPLGVNEDQRHDYISYMIEIFVYTKCKLVRNIAIINPTLCELKESRFIAIRYPDHLENYNELRWGAVLSMLSTLRKDIMYKTRNRPDVKITSGYLSGYLRGLIASSEYRLFR